MKYLPFILAISASHAYAQDTSLRTQVDQVLAPIAEISSLPDALHCAGLFRSLAVGIGAGTDISDGAAAAEEYMATTGGMLWFNAEGTPDTTPEEVFDVLVPLINGVAIIYIDQLPTLLGEDQNPLQDEFFDQYTYCTAILEALQDDTGG